jgi:hypothetical protein
MSIRHPLASLFVLAGLGLVMPQLGCNKKKDDASADDDESAGKKKKKKGDDDDKADDDKGGKKKKKKGDDDDKSAKGDDDDKGGKKKKGDDDDDGKKKGDDDDKGGSKKSAGGPLKVNLEGKDIDFKYGKVRTFGSYLEVRLSTEDIKCDAFKGSDDAYTLTFNLSPGVDGKFYSGQKIGVNAHWSSESLKMKRETGYSYETVVVVDPFKLSAKEAVGGTIDFDVAWNDFSDTSKKKKYTGSGKWAATLCSDYSDYKSLTAIDDPGSDALAGSWTDKAGKKESFEPKSGLVIVHKDSYSKEQYYGELMFFESEKVACSETWDARKKTKMATVTTGFAGISGSGEKHQLGGLQPASASISFPVAGKDPTSHYFSEGRATVKFSEYKYEGGDKVTAFVSAQSPKSSYDGSGELKGKMEVKVCNSGF